MRPQVITGARRTLLRCVRGILLAQYSLEDFTARVSWDDVCELDCFRLLEASEFVLAEREDFVRSQSGVSFHHNGEGDSPHFALF